ncbi:MAG: ketopantoate reductase family protein [Spirochaetaceae bacterium]|jgi:2-dehydropantoate 2-reductase|nr:ketopantoate reductase family protein [Spirochaetaceae bacterium]
MKILIYGAGVIGSIFAGKIAQKEYGITVLARGNRYTEIKENGIILKNSLTNKMIKVNVKITNTLMEDDIYDYIIVTVQNTQIDEILPVLSKNNSQNIVFVVNNPLGYKNWAEMVGYDRIIIGFPSAGGERNNGIINYFIGTGISKIFQSTTFGELNGKNTKRLKGLYKIFRKSGFSPSLNNKMDWWQKTHLAVILPIAKALYRYGSNNYELAKSSETIKNMILGTRDLFNVLKNINIKITPTKLNFYYLPVILLKTIWKIIMRTKIAEYAMAKHTIVGKEELKILEKQFMSLNKKGIGLKYYNKI